MKNKIIMVVLGAVIAGLGVLGIARDMKAKPAAPAAPGQQEPLPSFDGSAPKPGQPA